ncbi:MAG: hypothetical protein JKX67_00810 [Colwellia sp.]|nr:hypothetical protein [Colwellia sp.]
MNNASFQAFLNVLNEDNLSVQDSELIFQLDHKIKTEIQPTLEAIGYEFDEARTVRNGQVFLSLNAVNWANKSPIYETWEELFLFVSNSSNLPKYFYVIESNNSCFDNTHNQQTLMLFCLVRQLLPKLADHCEPQQGPAKGSRKLFFIIEADDGVAKYEFNPFLDWQDVKSLEDVAEQITLVKKLSNIIQLGDSQDSERKSVMRSAFHELISVCHNEAEIFKKFIFSISHFHKRYEEHYELFVKRFSINKVLHEINEQDLTYTSKINEIISSAQNKALAIPGALIVIAAVMKIDHVVDGIAVAIGMLVTTFIVHRSLEVHQATFDHIGKQVDSEFKRYDILNEDVEIRKQAKSTNEELLTLLNKAKSNSSFMTKTIWFICLMALMFILFVSNSLHQADADEIKNTQVIQPKKTVKPETKDVVNLSVKEDSSKK